MQANLKFNCQFAGEKLASQEEFPLGGIDYIRGYPSQDYMADNAFRANCELLLPSFWIPEDLRLPYSDRPLKDDITCLLFFDQGYGEKRGILPGEIKNVYYAGYGPGIRIRVYDQLLLRLEWGFIAGDRPITEMATSRFHFSLSFEDKLPELMGKIFHSKNAAE
jgi:hemolysin activation/secretion protein